MEKNLINSLGIYSVKLEQHSQNIKWFYQPPYNITLLKTCFLFCYTLLYITVNKIIVFGLSGNKYFEPSLPPGLQMAGSFIIVSMLEYTKYYTGYVWGLVTNTKNYTGKVTLY